MVAVCTAIALMIAAYVLGRVYLHLRYNAVAATRPAHWSVPYTGLWMWWQHVQDRSAAAVHQAHLCHGPVVRLGPSELSVCCVDGGLNVIYGTRDPMPKTDWYQVANSHGQEPMVAIKEEAAHRERKRMLQPPYSKTSLRTNRNWSDAQLQLSDRLASALCSMSTQPPCHDFYDLAFAWSVDSTANYVLGSDADSQLLDDLTKARRWRKTYEQERSYQFLPLPTILLKWMGYTAEISWVSEMTRKARSSSPEDTGTVINHFVEALKTHRKNHRSPTPNNDDSLVSSELQDHMVAGIDTSAIVLTACAYLLSVPANHTWQGQLRDELLSAQQSLTAVALEKLPILDAIVKETLRLHAPVAGSQPRITPNCVELGPPGHGIILPQGVTVHSQAYTLHRSTVFEDPETFNPGRWLHASPEKLAEMKRWYWPFGSGSRACIGMQLGMDNLKIAVATLFRDYSTEVVQGTSFAVSSGVIASVVDQGGYHLRIRLQPMMNRA